MNLRAVTIVGTMIASLIGAVIGWVTFKDEGEDGIA